MNKLIRIESVVRAGDKVTFHVVIDETEGQYRGTIEYDHEPSDKELKKSIRAWHEGIQAKKDIKAISLDELMDGDI